jgi:nitrogen fixation/metabolism regulation signal transduction histidine kinase
MASFRDKSKNFDSIFEKVSNTLLNQIENLNLIASEFSRFAKMPSIKLEEVDLISIARDSINLFIDEKIKIDFETNLSSAIIEADINQLRRLMINLIRNSIQAGATNVNINILSENGHFSILVKDNGSGIPEQFRDKIFDSSFTTKEKGMGLGLKLARRFLEGINGNISLFESSGKGTIFKITLDKMNEKNENPQRADK